MSWDVSNGGRNWSYTHNCNRMIEAVLEDLAVPIIATTKPSWWGKINPSTNMGSHCWWDLLDGLDAAAGRELIGVIVKGLEADPDRFRAMNPANGWGDYHSLVETLREMRDTAENGCWSAGG